MIIFLCILLAFVALLLIGIVLIQDSSAGGLTGAFGGGGGGGELLGAKGQKELAKFTTILASSFVGLCILVGVMQALNEKTSAAPDDEAPATSKVGSADPGAGAGDTIPAGNTTDGIVPAGTAPADTVPPTNTGDTPPANSGTAPGNTPVNTQPTGTPPAAADPETPSTTTPPAEGDQGGQ